MVKNSEGCNLLDIDGKLQSDIFFEEIVAVHKNGFFGRRRGNGYWEKIKLDKKYNYYSKWEAIIKEKEDNLPTSMAIMEKVMWVWGDRGLSDRVFELFV